MKPKRFIAITTEIVDSKVVLIGASSGDILYNENGIDFQSAIEFLFSLVFRRDKKQTTVFVCYGFARDLEFLFAGAPRSLKDKIFQSEFVKRKISEIETENESIDAVRFKAIEHSPEYLQADFERSVNNLFLRDLLEIQVGDFLIKCASGKFLSIKGHGKQITFYDVFGFFKPQTLRNAVKTWLGKDLVLLDRKELNNLSLDDETKTKVHYLLESTAIRDLTAALNTALENEGMNLTRYYGASALSSYLLGRLKAKQDFYNYRYRRQLSPELFKAVRQANYGGRSEQFKIGTLNDVYVYDLNSAYAHAITFLPKMLRKPHYSREWNTSPFSVWYLEYDFRNLNPYFGFLPNREVSGLVKYRQKGCGYFWQPEVSYILNNFPNNVEVKGGFSLGYEQADFAKGIETLYALRLELQRRGSPLEKVFKLALASIYGKFCQHNGRSHYYNLFYAGFITSFVRMRLLETVQGYEQETICFQTDAIHSLSGSLNGRIADGLGDYKRQQFANVCYLDNAVYRANTFDQTSKIKSRGFRVIEFDAALAEVQDRKTYTALADFFVGHNLWSQQMFSGAEYLQHLQIPKVNNPIERGRSAMRLFEVLDIDLSKEYFDSKPITGFTGMESAVYRQQNYSLTDLGLDSIEAGRV